jgi:hypothetical protein
MLALAACLLATIVSSHAGAQAPTAGDMTYIELILDSSISMSAFVEGWRSRMDVAKAVMEQLIRDLPEDPNLMVALRIYGAELRPNLTPCEDTVLVQPFAPVAKARQNMINQVKAMKARGMTPIALSLEQAAKDFPDKSARNIIVLITDGEESCGGDPCAVSARLQADGFVMKPYVVGFALTEKQAALVRCIGEYFSASDTASLRQALSTIMARAVAPAQIEVQAWAGATNVTRQAEIEIVKSTGEIVQSTRTAQDPPVVRAQVDEGQYIVRGRLAVGSQILSAQAAGIVAKPGQTSVVRLDFGPLDGRVRVTARASGQDVSDRVDIRVLEAGRPVAADWAGIPPAATLPAGDYTVVVTHRQYPELTRTATATVQTGRDTYVDVDLGELPATLEVTVTYRGAVMSNLCQLSVLAPGQAAQVIRNTADGRVFRWTSTPGVCDLNVMYRDVVAVEKAVPGVQLAGGRTTSITVSLDDLLGALRVRVVAGGRDITGDSRVTAAGRDGKLELPFAGGMRQALVVPGVYAVSAIYRDTESDMYEAYVKQGETTDLTIEVKLPGRIAIIPTVEGKPMRPDKLRAWAYLDGAAVGDVAAQPDRVEIIVPEGKYNVVGEISDPFAQRREAPGIQVRAGETVQVKMNFDPAGLLRVRVMADGKPLEARAWVHFFGGEGGKWTQMDQVSRGVLELKVPEGVHDVEIDPELEGIENKWLRGVEIAGGTTVEKTVDIGGSSLLRLRVVADGKPLEARAWVHFFGGEGGKWTQMDQVSRGVLELKVPAGVHDIEISPDLEGIQTQWLRGVEITGGATVEKTVTIGALGLLRVRLIADGKPLNKASIEVYDDYDDYVMDLTRVAGGTFEARLPGGMYRIVIEPDDSDSYDVEFIDGIELDDGQTVELNVTLREF